MENICPYYKKCGGCNYQGIPYEEQLERKLHKVKSLIGPYVRVEKIIGMDLPYNYRNKVNAAFRKNKKGEIISGVYKEGTHELIAIDDCQIEDDTADKIIKTIRELAKSFKLQIYDEDRRSGVLRHVMVRTGYVSGQVMVVLVTGTPIFPSKNNFCKELRKRHPEITTIIQNINDKHTSMILGDKENIIYGKGYIEDTLCGYKFRISSKSFYQINHVQTEILYKTAIDYCDFKGDERLLDAYCGIGTIGITASKNVKEVIGVELNRQAVKDAIVNAKLNGIKNIRFINEDAGKYMVGLASQNEKVDVVIMDPPRTGSTEEFLASVIKLGPKKLVYISCAPETLARDLKYLVGHGYKCKGAMAVDMFAQTGHVECVVFIVQA